MQKTFKINVWILLLSFIVYAALSLWIFLYAYQGWIILSILPIVSVSYFVLLVILLVSAITRTTKKNTSITISVRALLVIIGIQVLAIILAGGDCGDAAGYHMFFQQILWQFSHHPFDCFWPNADLSPFGVFFILPCLYSISVLVFVINSVIKNKIHFSEFYRK